VRSRKQTKSFWFSKSIVESSSLRFSNFHRTLWSRRDALHFLSWSRPSLSHDRAIVEVRGVRLSR
ncbi:hypothetical protein CSPAE12_01946, partial [Colletotrichum incanum]